MISSNFTTAEIQNMVLFTCRGGRSGTSGTAGG
jgi:hypothetical protein